MTGTNCDFFTHNQSRSYLNHLVQNYGRTGVDRINLVQGQGQVAGFCELGNLMSGPVTCGEFPDISFSMALLSE